MQEKETIMVVWCTLKVPSLKLTVRHRSASLAMLNSYRTFVTHEYEIVFVHTYVTDENVKWPNLCYTQKYDI